VTHRRHGRTCGSLPLIRHGRACPRHVRYALSAVLSAHPRDPAFARYASFGGFESAVAREREAESGDPGLTSCRWRIFSAVNWPNAELAWPSRFTFSQAGETALSILG
jgi:hypothetical protein